MMMSFGSSQSSAVNNALPANPAMTQALRNRRACSGTLKSSGYSTVNPRCSKNSSTSVVLWQGR